MASSFKRTKSIPKYKGGGNFGKNAKALGLFAVDTALGTIAPNAISQDQYDDTKFGRSLGKVSSGMESLSSFAPERKLLKQVGADKGTKTGYTTEQQAFYDQMQPVGQAGSQIGEMWAGKGMQGINMGGGSKGAPQQAPVQGMMGDAISTQATQNYTTPNPNDPNQSLYARRGGKVSYPTNAIPMHGGNWAIPTFPSGGTFQVDGPSHEEGGVTVNSPNGMYEIEKEEAVQVTPNADRILSDSNKLRLPSTLKNPAQSYKPYQNKVERLTKLFEKGELDKYGQTTLKLATQASDKAFEKFYGEQEILKTIAKLKQSLKPDMPNKSTKRLGGIQQYDEGGYSQWRSIREKEGWVVDPRNASNAQYPSMYNPKAISIVQDTAHGSGWNIAPAKGVTDATDAYGFPNPNYYGSYNVPKQVIGTGQFETGYTPAPGGGGYIKIGDTSTIPTHKFINGTYQPIQTNRYGGVQKYPTGGTYTGFAEDPNLKEEELSLYTGKYYTYPNKSLYDFNMPIGGPLDQAILRDKNQSYKSDKTEYNYDPTTGKYYDDEEPSLGYTPKTLAEKYKMQQASLSKPKASIYNQETDPNGGSENWSDFNSPEFKKENQEMLARAQEAAKSEQSPKGSNWKEGVYQGVTGLASNMGEIYAMYKASKPVEVQQRYDYKPEVLNNTAADRAAWRMYKNTAESLKNAGLSGGQYASNLGANRASLTEQLDTQRINRENVNVGIRNDAQRTNIAGRYSVDDINARNRAAKENLQLKATERMGTNFAQQSKDYRATQQEKQMLPFMQKAFSDPAFQKMFAEWMASNGGKRT